MKELLIFLLLAGAVGLFLDDKSQRAAVEQEQEQIQELTTERDQLNQHLAVASAPKSDWFQQRLQEAPALSTGTVGGFGVK